MLSLHPGELTEAAKHSWKRCQNFGLSPSEPADNDLLTGSRIKECINEHQRLITYASCVFDQFHTLIKQSGQMAILADAQGTILHAVGEPDFTNKAAMVQLQVGANWEERRKGTNAIGVAIADRTAVRIHAGEHYLAANRFLTCASAPILSQAGELLGVIDISGRHEYFHDYTLALAQLAAEAIQNKLLLDDARHEHVLALRELEYTNKHHPLPLLTLDRDNHITRANPAALRILGKDAVGTTFSGANGFEIETIQGEAPQVWRSVAIKRTTASGERLYSFEDIKGSCPVFAAKKELARKSAAVQLPVLLLGESGTGKELFAQSIHTASPRAAGAFIAVNCSAIPDSLVESELFGYERGAFTGANKDGSIGKFEAAHKGTIFLDEIGDMSLRAQAALLRVLQESTITPVGSTRSKRIDTRVIAATHRNLAEEVKAGRFREDLLYRLRGIQIALPSLRDRSDVLELAEHMLQGHGRCQGRLFTDAAAHQITAYSWPGNIRELGSVLLQASFLAEGDPIGPEHLQLEESLGGLASGIEHEQAQLYTARAERTSLSMKEAEIEVIRQALRHAAGNLTKAAAMLQIGRTTLYRKIEEYGIDVFKPIR